MSMRSEPSTEVMFVKTVLKETFATLYLMMVCFLKTDLTSIGDPVFQKSFETNAFYNFFYGITLWGIVVWSVKFSVLYLIYKYLYDYDNFQFSSFSGSLIKSRNIPIGAKIFFGTIILFFPKAPYFARIFLRYPLLFVMYGKPLEILPLLVLLGLALSEIIGYLMVPKDEERLMFLDISWVLIVVFLATFLPV